MIYTQIKTFDDLAVHFDDLCMGVTKMLGKTGGHGNSAETVVGMMASTAGKDTSLILVAHDEAGRFEGFIFALLIPNEPPWVDFIGMWTRPGVASRIKRDAFTILKEWAISKGCKSILAGITRKPEVFFKFFHEPLGFKNIGLILEYDLTKETSDA